MCGFVMALVRNIHQCFLFLVFVNFGLFEVESVPCNSLQFPCDDGSCVLKSLWCDSREDCPDDSDEEYCSKRTKFLSNPHNCSEKYFLCKDGPCIPIIGRCDGIPTCEDESDEENCVTGQEFYAGTKLTGTVEEKYGTNLFTSNLQRLSTDEQRTTTINTPVDIPLKHFNDSHFDNLQSDAAATRTVEVQDLDILNGFKKIDTSLFHSQKMMAENWLYRTHDDEYGWGDETARAITALFLSDTESTKTKSDEMLMLKQLNLKLALALIGNQTKIMPLSELASYINALLSTCDNPRNFHGYNLVDILRQRTNSAQTSAKYISPLVYLTLCISNATEIQDVSKLREMSNSYARNKSDAKALLALAATCIDNIPKFSYTRIGFAESKRLYEWIKLVGLPQNIYELALVTQALNEAKINQDKWNRLKALTLIVNMQQANGSFGDILSTYYALPVFSGKSLLSLAKLCKLEENGMIPLNVLMNGEEKQYVMYSLRFGNPPQFTQDLTIKVGKSTSFFDVMRIAEYSNPLYRFKFDSSRDKPFVYSIGGVVDDAEKGMYWTMYVRPNANPHPLPFEGDIRRYVPKPDDHITFWYKNIFDSTKLHV